jgi:CBS domain-containing protein
MVSGAKSHALKRWPTRNQASDDTGLMRALTEFPPRRSIKARRMEREESMLVSQILKSKSDDSVVTVAPGTTVAQTAEILSSRRIGAVIVSPDGKRVSGIVSERDIVREIGRRGMTCMSDTVDSIMTSNIVGCRREEQANDVLQKMTDGRFRHMPVMDGSQMVGFISIGDVVKARLTELAMEKDALEGMIKGF